MAEPLAQTFRILTTAAHPHGDELAVAALDLPLPSIQCEAIRALVKWGNVREQMEAIRRYPRFAPPVREQLERAAASLVPAIRECLLPGGDGWEFPALELARGGEVFEMIETLLEILRSGRTDLHGETVRTLRHLVNRLHEQLHEDRTSEKPPLKNAEQIQHMVLTALEKSLESSHDISHVDVVVESLFVLGGPSHSATQKLLNHENVECRSLARELLLASQHPGVMRFLLDPDSKLYPTDNHQPEETHPPLPNDGLAHRLEK